MCAYNNNTIVCIVYDWWSFRLQRYTTYTFGAYPTFSSHGKVHWGALINYYTHTYIYIHACTLYYVVVRQMRFSITKCVRDFFILYHHAALRLKYSTLAYYAADCRSRYLCYLEASWSEVHCCTAGKTNNFVLFITRIAKLWIHYHCSCVHFVGKTVKKQNQ